MVTFNVGNGSSKIKMVVALDRHKLGMVGGACTATIIMAVCFFWQHAELDAAIIRVGWSFVIAYGLFYLFTDRILRVTLLEFVIDKNKKRTRRLGKESSVDSAEVPEEPEVDLQQDGAPTQQVEAVAQQIETPVEQEFPED